jgi:hypothetical protein
LVSLRNGDWPWAAGSILAVVLVIGGALAGHRIVVSARQNAAVAPAPTLAPAQVVAVTNPSLRIGLSALDGSAGHLVALATTGAWPQCPPVGACPAAPEYDTLVLLDSSTGRTLAQGLLSTSTAADARALLVDPAGHTAYAVGGSIVAAFSTLSGAPGADYSVPDGLWQGTLGAALDPSDGALLITDGASLLALDAPSGHRLARQTLPVGAQWTDGPVVDATQARVFILQRTATATALLAFDTRTLVPAGRWELLAGSRLGPFDEATHSVYQFLPDGTVARLAVGVSAGGTTTLSSSMAPALSGAVWLGWNGSLGHVYAAGDSGLIVRNAATGAALASLPIRAAGAPDTSLAVDAVRGLVYLPTSAGELVIARDGLAGQPLGAQTALLLGRAAMARFLPDTNQDPPFVTPESFPAGAGTRTQDYWIHFSDLGWQGPYTGSATSTVAPESGHPGAFVVSYTIAWNQLFPRSHMWTCEVRPDGSVHLQSQSGDAVP